MKKQFTTMRRFKMKAYLELRKQVNEELKVILKRDFGVTSFLRIKNGISFEEMRKYFS